MISTIFNLFNLQFRKIMLWIQRVYNEEDFVGVIIFCQKDFSEVNSFSFKS